MDLNQIWIIFGVRWLFFAGLGRRVRHIHATFHFVAELRKKTQNCSMYTNQDTMFICTKKERKKKLNHIWDAEARVNAVRK